MRGMMMEVGSAAVRYVPVKEVVADLLRGSDPIEERSLILESYRAEDLIEGALAAFGHNVAVSTAFGLGGLVVMQMAQKFDPGVRAFYIDTGFAFPETEKLLARWVDEQRLNLLRVLPKQTIEQQAAEYGDELWKRNADLCCKLRKVEPNNRALEGVKLWIAALRRDEATTRATTPMLSEVELPSGHKLLKLCPIVRWTKKNVWAYVCRHRLPYNELHDRGYPSIGCTHCTRAVKPGEDERAGRWSGTSKVECGLHVVPRRR
jgi:phosphoadenosine phosphosulfate reductase